MDLFDAMKGALRRWYVLLPVLLVTAVVAVLVGSHKTTQYKSQMTVAVTTGSTSVQSAVPSGAPTVTQNNALVTNGGVTLVANLLSIGMTQTSVLQQVSAAGGTTNYSVDVVTKGPSAVQLPIVTIAATANSARQVAIAMSVLARQANNTLIQIQRSAGVPSAKYAKSFVLEPATPPTRDTLSVARNVGVVIVVGVVVALVFAAVLDNILLRRRRRRLVDSVLSSTSGASVRQSVEP